MAKLMETILPHEQHMLGEYKSIVHFALRSRNIFFFFIFTFIFIAPCMYVLCIHYIHYLKL